jgi:amino acid transporter/mannitol/fructose-specific phosphotransferase system IIA component (Ntr-type)
MVKDNKLKRDITLLDIFCFASGAMISSGIFILPGLAYSRAGPLVFISYLLAGVLAFIGTLGVIELATAMPKAGGDYFFITRSLGPFVGTISSFFSWSALCLKSAFAIFGIAEILYLLFGFPILISSFFTCCFFVGLNIFGVKESAKFEVMLVLALFAIMLFFIFGGAAKISISNYTQSTLLPQGINGLLKTAGFVFISFGGLLTIASVSGEVQNPTKNIPRGMILSMLAVILVYVAMLIVMVGVLPADKIPGSLTPIADTGRILFGNTGYFIISLAAFLAFVTTANAGILSASRYPLALSRDNLLPPAISKLSKTKKTPIVAIGITGLFIFICLLLDLSTLVKLGSVVILSLYILTNIAIIILREAKIQNYQPAFKVPFYPWINIAAIILFILLIIDMGLVAIELSLSLLLLVAVVYFFYGRKRHKISYAFLHLVERVINKKITSNNLEDELKNIIIHRDQLKIDRVHRLVEDSVVIDITGSVDSNQLFQLLAEEVSNKIGLDKKEIIDLFKQREKEGSTAITPLVAIPHIIIPGQNKFKLIIVRCKEGIKFTEKDNNLKAVFVLFGTKDQRTFHLKVLAALAGILQNQNFEKLWLTAKDKQQIKDILLLGQRFRS